MKVSTTFKILIIILRLCVFLLDYLIFGNKLKVHYFHLFDEV